MYLVNRLYIISKLLLIKHYQLTETAFRVIISVFITYTNIFWFITQILRLTSNYDYNIVSSIRTHIEIKKKSLFHKEHLIFYI